MKTRKGVRQGDVLLVPIDRAKIPDTARPVKVVDGRVVLSEGEAANHLHMLDVVPGMIVMTDDISNYVLMGDEPTRLAHETTVDGKWEQADHDPLYVSGQQAYEVVQQRKPSFSEDITSMRSFH